MPKHSAGQPGPAVSLDAVPPELTPTGDLYTEVAHVRVVSGRCMDLGPLPTPPDQRECRRRLNGVFPVGQPGYLFVYPLDRYACLTTLRGRLAVVRFVADDPFTVVVEATVWS